MTVRIVRSTEGDQEITHPALSLESWRKPVRKPSQRANAVIPCGWGRLVFAHTFPDQQDKVYPPLLGDRSQLTGASLQNSWSQAHQRTLKWVTESTQAGKPWVVANDEQNPASMGVPPDPG